MDEKIELLKFRIESAINILITSHIRPDGDAVGSIIAFGLALIETGKNVEMVLVDGIPNNFSHLTGTNKVRNKPKSDFDVSIVLDCSEVSRIGIDFEQEAPPTINIDHHITNDKFAEINIIEPSAPATTEILADIFPQLGLEISTPVADALLTGLITDTLGFRTCNMHPNTFRIAAALMEKGSDLQTLYKKALLNRSYKALKYWSAGLSKLQLEDRVLWTSLTIEEKQRIGYPGRDDADLINILSSVNDVDVALIFVEQPRGTVKVSWRGSRGIDVSTIAKYFGGGGHKPAAGADIEGELETVRSEVIARTKEFLFANNENLV